MEGVTIVEVALAALLAFFVPGYCVTRATFPEWRVVRPLHRLRLLETIALSFVVSVALTVVVGEILLAASPSGFQAYWTDPILESLLGALALVAFAVAWVRGAFRPTPPGGPSHVDASREEDPWALMGELDRLERDRRRAMHQLRRSRAGTPEFARIQAEINRIDSRRVEILREREEEYAS